MYHCWCNYDPVDFSAARSWLLGDDDSLWECQKDNQSVEPIEMLGIALMILGCSEKSSTIEQYRDIL